MNTQKQIFVIVVLFFTLVGGCGAYSLIDLPHRAAIQTTYTQDESITRGALLFANNCRNCHGIKGQGGVGLVLNKDAFKDQDPLVLKANRDLITRTLQCGRAGTLMPAWLNTNGGSLNAEQISHLVDFITAPLDPRLVDDENKPTNQGWLETVTYAENLNRANTALIGGDTLDTIAKAHGIGYQELSAANNNQSVNIVLNVGEVVHIPAFKGMPEGYDYHVYNTNETLTKVADSQHVGAMILADLNNLPYTFTESKDKADYTLLDPQGTAVPGLFPGDKLQLPANATYVVTAGDTVNSIAQQHGVSASDITSLNSDILGNVAPDQPVDYQNKLKLPPNTRAVVQPGQTVAVIASLHGLTAADIEQANGLQPGAQVAPGTALSLPANARYVIQTGDTLALVANLHGISVDTLASANGLKPDTFISPDVVLKLPRINAYNVNGQSLDDVAKTFSNVTADSLASTNGVPANAIIRIGTKLNVPPDAWGPAPATTKNPGTACVQYAIPNAVFDTLPGIGTPTAEVAPAAPAGIAKSVEIDAGPSGTDWTVIADGTKQPPNQGNVAVAAGTAIKFVDQNGLHTINLNGKQDGDVFKQGDTRTITFSTPGKFTITCSFHPSMLAYVTVQ